MTMRLDIDGKSNRTSVLLAAAALLLGSAVAAGAQTTQLASADARWTPWVGCWQASMRDADQTLAPNKAAPVVCIVPTTGSATVDLVTVTGSTVGQPERVDANGQRRAVNREGCNGWETAQFSPDAKRIYLHSQHECTGNRTRLSSGIMSILPNGEWLDVQGLKVESHTGVRVVHYGRVPVPAGLSADMKAALEGHNLATTTAVIAASDSVRIADVIEATKNVDPLVVQTWLAQRGQGFGVDRKKLEQLADAKVPSNVIDVMVALSYPQVFAINLAQADGQMIQTQSQQVAANNDEGYRPGPTVFMNWDPFYSGYSYGYRSGLYGLGYGYGYPYGTYYPGTPVVIVRPSPSVDQPAPDNRGKMVRGSGYTRPPDRADGGSSSSPRGSTSSGDGGSRTSGGGSSSSGGEHRTAKPRSP